MVRLIKNGHRIRLLAAPSQADGEDDSCPDCKEKFNRESRRRCCYVLCEHVTCLDCVRESKTGCCRCTVDEKAFSSSNVAKNLTVCPSTLPLTVGSGPVSSGIGHQEDIDGEPEPPILEKETEVYVDVENSEPEGDDHLRSVLRQQRKSIQNYEDNQLQELSTSSRMGRWPCKHCNHLCLSKASLDEHLSKDHSKGSVATQKGLDIQVHPRIRTKERPFQCYLCGLSFNRIFHLVRHMEAKHRDQVHLLPETSSKKSGDMRCPVCNFKFQSHGTKKYSLLRRAKNASCDHICCLGCIARMAGSCSLCSLGESSNVKRLPQKGRKIKSFPREQQKRQLMMTNKNRNRQSSLGTTAMLENNVDQISKGTMGTSIENIPEYWGCQLCGLTYCRQYSLQRHVERGHKDVVKVSPGLTTQNSEMSQCPKCKVQFEMQKHSRYRRAYYVQCEHYLCLSCLIGEDLRCSQCVGGSTGENQPVSSKRNPNGLVRMMKDIKGEVEVSDQENVRTEQKGRFRCLICGFTFSRHLSFERHLNRMHGVELLRSENEIRGAGEFSEVNSGEDLYCPECQEEFGTTEENQKAKYTSCGHTSCLKCVMKAELGCGKCTTENDPRFIFGSAVKSRRGMDSASDILSSNESQSSPAFASPASIKRKVGRPRKSFNLKQQSGEFLGALQSQSFPNEKPLCSQPNNDIQLGPNKIQQNGSTKKTASQRNKPVYRQTGMKIIRCNHCGKGFVGKKSRNLHIQKFHSEDRRHVCKYCQWRSQSPRDLQRHILQHTKEKPFKCNLCAAEFTRKFTLVNHMKRSHLSNKKH